jgi:hypothetical protein
MCLQAGSLLKDARSEHILHAIGRDDDDDEVVYFINEVLVLDWHGGWFLGTVLDDDSVRGYSTTCSL